MAAVKRRWTYPAKGDIQKGDEVYMGQIKLKNGYWKKARGAIGHKIYKRHRCGCWKVGEVRRRISTKAKRK
jgi:hypothetical protein